MGAWGTEVWQDDTADDVLIMFERLLEAGATPREAVRLIILHPPYGWGDDDDEPVQILALAALALKYEMLTPTIRRWAISTIESGAPMGTWPESTPEDIAARKQILEQLKAILQHGTATAEELESVTGPQRV
jgi:hypothetical protein